MLTEFKAILRIPGQALFIMWKEMELKSPLDDLLSYPKLIAQAYILAQAQLGLPISREQLNGLDPAAASLLPPDIIIT